MIALPVCRWREEQVEGRYFCNSARFCEPPNLVSAAFCATCSYADHDPAPPLAQTLPCVHLGRPLAGEVEHLRGGDQIPRGLFTCALHDHCTIDPGDQTCPTQERSCATCLDYVPRNPFGPNSVEMLRQAEEFLAAVPAYPKDRYKGRGVVIAGGGDRFFPSIYVTVRALRHVGCRLPIQVWYLGRNREMPPKRKALLAPFEVECVDADRVRRSFPARRLGGWELKVFATLHSPFEELLFLDADCYPCRNPEYVFELEDYRTRGAVFWPDAYTADDQRLVWSAFGVRDPRRLGSIESGQFFLNKRQNWKPLNLAWFYNDHSDYYYRYCYGDKHTFEVAWARCARPFVMWQSKGTWVDVAYLHPGPDHQPLFVHRCCDKFRFDDYDFTTLQRHPLPRFCSSLPLERECWGWMSELARITGRTPINEQTGAPRRPSRASRANRALFEPARFDISPYLFDSDPWLCKESPDDVRWCYDWKFRIAQVLQPRRILELGVRFGYSAAAFLAASPGAEYYGVDADNGEDGGTIGAYREARAMLARKFPDRTITIRKLDTQTRIPTGKGYDLVHVDADHSYEGCLNDLQLAARLGRRWVLVDDIHHAGCPSVALAVKDFLAKTGFSHVYFDDSFRGDCLIRLPDRQDR